MFVETVTAPREEWERWTENLRFVTDPPAALVATVAWVGADGLVTALNVWDSAEAVSDFYVERVHAVVQAEAGEPHSKPTRHGEPLVVYIRP
jgi:hypothetical protein